MQLKDELSSPREAGQSSFSSLERWIWDEMLGWKGGQGSEAAAPREHSSTAKEQPGNSCVIPDEVRGQRQDCPLGREKLG